VGRVDRLRCDQREDICLEIFFQPLLLPLGKLFDQRNNDASLGQESAQDLQAFLLAVFQFEDLLANGIELLPGAAAIDPGCFDTALELSLQTRDTHRGEFVRLLPEMERKRSRSSNG
jgi:hypothetical protein